MPLALRSTDAHLDVLEVWVRIARQDLKAADRLIDEIETKCLQLSQMPELGRRRDELLPGLRSVAVRGYVIIYRPIPEGIRVMRVIHGSRDLAKLF